MFDGGVSSEKGDEEGGVRDGGDEDGRGLHFEMTKQF